MPASLSNPRVSTGKVTVLSAARLIHAYLGVFIAPALLFFALTGAMQTFSLHEKPWGDTGKPPHWIAVLARLHKDQMTYMPPRHREGPPPATPASIPSVASGVAAHTSAPSVGTHPHTRGPNALPMKLFFLLVALMLASSVVTGLVMAFRYRRNKWALGATLAAGVVVPVILLFLQKV